jgi:uncharacterized membrane protein YoaK (UPF0700 family)
VSGVPAEKRTPRRPTGFARRLPAEAARDGILVGLTFVSGAVDAFSYLGLGRVFTANMTGNLVLLGIAAGQGQLLSALRAASAFGGFAGGVLLGATLARGGPPVGRWHPRVTVCIAIELLLLAALAAWWILVGGRLPRGVTEALIALSSVAMGVQTAAVRRLAVPGVTTTYVTGTLTGVLAQLAEAATSRRGWGLPVVVLASLVAGAAAGAVATVLWRGAAPVVPAAVLAAVTLAAAVRFGLSPRPRSG